MNMYRLTLHTGDKVYWHGPTAAQAIYQWLTAYGKMGLHVVGWERV
jgi:hypothetical protein